MDKKIKKSSQPKPDKSFENKVYEFYKKYNIQPNGNPYLNNHIQNSEQDKAYYGTSPISGTTNPNILI